MNIAVAKKHSFWYVKISGPVDSMNKAVADTKTIINDILYETFEFSKPGQFYSIDLNAFLSNVKNYLFLYPKHNNYIYIYVF